MVGLSFCAVVGTRDEKAKMAEYRKKEWPRRYKARFSFSFNIFIYGVEHLPQL